MFVSSYCRGTQVIRYSKRQVIYASSTGSPHQAFNSLAVAAYCMSLSARAYIDGLMQERRNSIANALELCLPCTNPLISSGPLFTDKNSILKFMRVNKNFLTLILIGWQHNWLPIRSHDRKSFLAHLLDKIMPKLHTITSSAISSMKVG